MKTDRKFRTETELVNEFVENYAGIFLRKIQGNVIRRFVLLEQFDCYNGVADIVLAVFRPHIRPYERKQPVNHNWLLPLIHLPKNEDIDTNKYAEMFGVSTGAARRHLYHFAQAGFLERVDDNRCCYRVSKAYTPVLESTISLEAKLHDWKRALAQAYRYRGFSNCAFVLLPAGTASTAMNNLELFRRHDVGLVTVGTDGLRIHHCPEHRNRPMNAAFLKVNEAACEAYRC